MHCPGKILVIYCFVLRDDGAESSDSKDNRQSKARRLGGGTGFFSTHKPTARAARVACPGNLAALKPPLLRRSNSVARVQRRLPGVEMNEV